MRSRATSLGRSSAACRSSPTWKRPRTTRRDSADHQPQLGAAHDRALVGAHHGVGARVIAGDRRRHVRDHRGGPAVDHGQQHLADLARVGHVDVLRHHRDRQPTGPPHRERMIKHVTDPGRPAHTGRRWAVRLDAPRPVAYASLCSHQLMSGAPRPDCTSETAPEIPARQASGCVAARLPGAGAALAAAPNGLARPTSRSCPWTLACTAAVR